MAPHKKTKILIANDFSSLGTGYAVYGKELLSRLQATGKYEIAEIACYATPEIVSQTSCEWKIYPNLPGNNATEEERKNFSQNQLNVFGSFKFHEILAHFRPDIVFDIRDYWMYSYQETSMYRDFFKWVVMPTVDSAPQKHDWLITFSNMDLVIPYTEWAKKILEKQCGSSIKLFPEIAKAGVDLNTFVPPESKEKIKQELFGNHDLSITGVVMRNQKRKLFPDIFKAYRKYLDKLLSESKTELYDKSYLVIHSAFPEMRGWDFPKLLVEFELVNKVFFTYQCRKCNHFVVDKFKERGFSCKKCNENLSVLSPTPSNPISSETMSKLYQSFDLLLQIAICEGFGMPQAEAAACGVPIASVDYSAMSEIARNLEGYKIPCKLSREIETGADRAYVNPEDIVSILYFHHNLPKQEQEQMSIRSRHLCAKHYSWDDVAKTWEKALDSVDISTNLNWDHPKIDIDSSFVIQNDVPRKTIKSVTDNVLKMPHLYHASETQKMINDINNGYMLLSTGQTVPFTLAEAVKHFDRVACLRKYTEEIRTDPAKIANQEFLNVRTK